MFQRSGGRIYSTKQEDFSLEKIIVIKFFHKDSRSFQDEETCKDWHSSPGIHEAGSPHRYVLAQISEGFRIFSIISSK